MSNLTNTTMGHIEPQTGTRRRCGQLSRSNHLIEYAQNTTIHGVKYLGEKRRRTVTEKLFWGLTFAISFIFLGFFIYDVMNKFNQKCAVLVEDEWRTPIHSIPFPAITICPAVKIKSEFLSAKEAVNWMQGVADDSMVSDLAYLICNQQFLAGVKNNDKRNISAQYLNQSHIELLHEISPTMSNTFKAFQLALNKKEGFYNDNDVPFSNILTNEGICFTFNVPSEIISDEPSLQTEYKYHNIQNKAKSWDSDDGYSGYPRYPRVFWSSGQGNGLYFILEARNSDLNTFCQPTKLGYKIMLHSPDEYPTTLEKFISIPHNTFSQIKVTPKIIKTSYDLSKLNPQVRQCFFNVERKLKYFTFYNRVNCKLECMANYTLQQYGCVHFSLPRNNSQPICGPNVKISQMYDTEEIMSSYFEYKAKMFMDSNAELDYDEPIEFQKFYNFHCNCLPACNSLEYRYSIITEKIEIEKIRKKYFPTNDYVESATVMIDIFFGVTKVTGMTRKQFYTFSHLISNIGGLVGLFTGASILSIFEIIYFLFVR